MSIFERVKLALTQSFDRQMAAVGQWHDAEPGDFPEPCPAPSAEAEAGLDKALENPDGRAAFDKYVTRGFRVELQ